MKKEILTIIMVFFTVYLFSQSVDTTVIKIKNRKIIVLNEKLSSSDSTDNFNFYDEVNDNDAHWAGIAFGATSFLNSNNLYDINLTKNISIMPEKSINVMFNFAEKSISLYKNKISLTTGLGFDFYNYRFAKNSSRVLSSDSTYITSYIDSNYVFTKSKLTSSYLTLPLLLEFNFNTKSDDNLFLSFGVVGELRIGSHSKYVYKLDGNTYKNKIKDRYHLNPFMVNYIAMIGYNDISLFAKYSYLPLYFKDEGPDLHPVSVGIMLNF